MNAAYISQNLGELQRLMDGGSYKPRELQILLDDRNTNWMHLLPSMMKPQPLFVAVGTLHLVGEKG